MCGRGACLSLSLSSPPPSNPAGVVLLPAAVVDACLLPRVGRAHLAVPGRGDRASPPRLCRRRRRTSEAARERLGFFSFFFFSSSFLLASVSFFVPGLRIPDRLMVTLGSLLLWALVYTYCGLCACIELLKLLWSLGTKPGKTFQWLIRENPPGCLNDPSLGTHCYVRIKDTGLRFHYVAAGERGKPLMLLLHGFPEFWYSWRHQMREFKSEYRVVALDLRGYGETDAPIHRENYKLDCLITDVKDILESLGYSKCVLIGHDWGGMIAWLAAICYPEMITKLIVINFPHPSVFTEFILRQPSQMIKSAYYYFFQMPWFPELMFTINDFKTLKNLFTSQSCGIGKKGSRLTAEDIEAYLYVFSQPGALTGPINHYRNLFSCLPLQHHEVTMPTLLLWGEKDPFLDVEMAEITRIYVKNQFRLTILSEANHWLQQDQPDIVNKLIWTFLKEESRKRE